MFVSHPTGRATFSQASKDGCTGPWVLMTMLFQKFGPSCGLITILTLFSDDLQLWDERKVFKMPTWVALWSEWSFTRHAGVIPPNSYIKM